MHPLAPYFPYALIALAICVPSACFQQRALADGAGHGRLPATGELEQWFAFSNQVERGLRDGDSRFMLELKNSGEGTSVYAKVKCDGKVIGAFLSENSSNSVVGEITSFNIARALGCGDLFQWATAMELRGKGLATFKQLVETAKLPERKEHNRWMVLNEIASEPQTLHGVFKQWLPIAPIAYRALELPDVPPNGALNTADEIAHFLSAEAPQPGNGEIKPAGIEGRAPARALAAQLSDILLVDALAGQWDRFSGDNLHMFIENGRARFAAVDNGGASFKDDKGYLARFKTWVTRFDKSAADNLFALEAFLDRPDAREFLGFRDERKLAEALGINSDEAWTVFEGRVRDVAQHVHAAEKQYGAASAYFFRRNATRSAVRPARFGRGLPGKHGVSARPARLDVQLRARRALAHHASKIALASA